VLANAMLFVCEMMLRGARRATVHIDIEPPARSQVLSFRKQVLGASYVPHTLLGVRDAVGNKTSLCSLELPFAWGVGVRALPRWCGNFPLHEEAHNTVCLSSYDDVKLNQSRLKYLAGHKLILALTLKSTKNKMRRQMET